MNRNNNIEIVEVANGWQVILPIEKNYGYAEIARSPDFREMGREMAIGMKQDPMLESKDDVKETKKVLSPSAPKRNKINNIFVFETFKELIEFLVFKFPEEK